MKSSILVGVVAFATTILAILGQAATAGAIG